jgi:hypothetical protein
MNNIPCIVMAIFLALVGATVFFPARKARNHDKIRESWPTAKGTVISSNAVASPLATGRGREQALYDAVVKYQFRAGGQLHFGETVAFPRRLFKEGKARQIAERYPAGSPITVHYNLENALECYLDFIPSPESRNYNLGILVFVVAAIALVGGMAAAVLGL